MQLFTTINTMCFTHTNTHTSTHTRTQTYTQKILEGRGREVAPGIGTTIPNSKCRGQQRSFVWQSRIYIFTTVDTTRTNTLSHKPTQTHTYTLEGRGREAAPRIGTAVPKSKCLVQQHSLADRLPLCTSARTIYRLVGSPSPFSQSFHPDNQQVTFRSRSAATPAPLASALPRGALA